MVENLAQLKRTLKPGTQFKVITHQRHPKINGLVREVTKVTTVSIYATIADNPEHEVSKTNNGKGYEMRFDKAKNYKFGNTIKWFDENNNLIMEFQVLE